MNVQEKKGTDILRQVARDNNSIRSSLEGLREKSKQFTKKDNAVETIHHSNDKVREISLESNGYVPCKNEVAPELSDHRPKGRGSCFKFISCLIFFVGVAAILYAIGQPLVDLVVKSWRQIVSILGGVLVGSGIIFIIANKSAASPFKDISPPDSNTNNPLEELESLARRATSRLRTAYKMHIIFVCFVATILLFLICWAVYMVTMQQIVYASMFGSSGIAMIILSKWKWQPFDRIAEARRHADSADVLVTGLRLRIKSLSEINDPQERANAQWKAVSDYLDKASIY